MSNKYLEKIASIEEEASRVRDAFRENPHWVTGVFGNNRDLKDRGYDSTFMKNMNTSSAAGQSDIGGSVKRVLIPTGGGAILGAALAHLTGGHAGLGAAVGTVAGSVAGGIHDTYDHWKNRIPNQLYQEILAGKYKKSED